jgi:hypothetical protein
VLSDLYEFGRWLPRTGPLFFTAIIDATVKISVTINLLTISFDSSLTAHQRFLPDDIFEFLLEAFRLGLLEKGSYLQLRLLNHLLFDFLL